MPVRETGPLWSCCYLHDARRCAYTNWSTTAHDCSDFFTDGEARSLFKRHIARIAFRNNTLTGIPYNQDPAIFGAPLQPIASRSVHQ